MLSSEQKNFFDENGYLILNQALGEEDLSDFRATFLSILAGIVKRAQKEFPHLNEIELGEHGDNALLALHRSNPEYISIFQRLISRTPEFFRLSSSKYLFGSMRELMQIEKQNGLYMLSNGIILTVPNHSGKQEASSIEKDWHQDTFFTIPESPYFQVWGPVLQSSTKAMGTLVVCPGSHKRGYGKQIFRPESSYNYRYAMAAGEVDPYEKVSVELEVGQMLIFHGRLIHASGFNETAEKFRISMIGICHNAENPACVPVSTHYLYHGKTPEAWFYEIYQDEKVKAMMNDQLAPKGPPVGGV